MQLLDVSSFSLYNHRLAPASGAHKLGAMFIEAGPSAVDFFTGVSVGIVSLNAEFSGSYGF